MAEHDTTLPAAARFPTRVPGLDAVLGGGLFKGGIYIVMGQPGAGKTILGNHVAFEHARAGGRVVYATLLAETHGRLLTFLRPMAFFDPALVGDAITYLNGYGAVETDGLAGLLQLVRDVVRDRRASLLVIDGMLTAGSLAETEPAYKKFVQQLQTWIEVVGCTVVLLASAREAELRPEYTMVDGIIELEYPRVGVRRVRELTVTKLRGTAFLEGRHTYGIDDRGVTLYGRVEAAFGRGPQASARAQERIPFGVPGLDAALRGGIGRCTSTLLLGAAGGGKTTLGIHFLGAGLAQGEKVVHFGFYEDPPALTSTGERMGLGFAEHLRSGALTIDWESASEVVLDRVGHAIVERVRRAGARRLFLDGVEALKRSAHPDRLPAFFSALTQELRTAGVTTLFTAEATRLEVEAIEMPFPGLSGIVDNLLVLRQPPAPDGALERHLLVVKTRDRGHAREPVVFTIGERGVETAGTGGRVRRAAGKPGRSRAVARRRGGRG